MADDQQNRRKAIANAGVLEDAPDDVGHLADGVAGVLSDWRRGLDAIQLQPRPCRRDRHLVHTAPARRQPREHDPQDERDEREPAECRHQHGAAERQPAAEVDVVAEEAGGAPLQPPRTARQPIAFRIDFRDEVIGTDRHRAEGPRMRVGDPLVIHRNVEEPGGAERLAGGVDLLQMAPERFLPLVDTEHGLERRWPGTGSERVVDERIVEAVTDGALEGAMQDLAAMDAVELPQLRFERCDVVGGPLLDDRGIEAAQLRDMEQRPRALGRRRGGRATPCVLQPRPQLRQRTAERDLPRRVLDRRP